MSSPSSPKRVFLTGASAGIGLATARALAEAGCEVWGTARDVARLPRELPGFHPVALDLEDAAGLEETFRAALVEAGGRFDALINNAGGGWFGPGVEIPPDELLAQFRALTLGPMALIRLATPSLRTRPGGLVVNVTSLAARLPLPFGAAYSAAKAALSAFTAGLQMEESAPTRPGEHRVRFVDVQPADINTGFNRVMRYWRGLDDPADPVAGVVRGSLAASDRSMAGAPPPEVVARVICRLVTDDATAARRALRTVGNVWQAVGGPLAYRFLPRRLMLWTVRKNCGL